MSRDFAAELKARIRKIDAPPRPPQVEAQQPEPPVKRYNIHKRSLPVGNPPLDKIVVFAVTKAEAEWWINHRLKAKSYQDDARDTKTLIYFDAVPVDAQPRERSIYFNPRPAISEIGERYFEFNQHHEPSKEIDWK